MTKKSTVSDTSVDYTYKAMPQVGDRALHRSNTLGVRPVSQVSKHGKKIKLDIYGYATPWLPAQNYLYRDGTVYCTTEGCQLRFATPHVDCGVRS